MAWSQTVAERRPGRPELRAVRPGLEHGERRPAGVPGRLQLPVGRALLRRGRPRAGVGGRHRRRQHPPLRGPPGQRRGRAARARRGRLRRGPRARGGHDVEPRGRGDAGPLPLARDLRPLPGRSNATPTCSTPSPSVGDQLGALLGDRVGTRVLHDEARPPVDDRELAELLARAAELSRRVTDALRRGGAQRSFLAEDGGVRPDPDRASRKTRTLQAAVHLAEDLHRFETRGDGEVAWVDGTRRNVRLRLSPIDVGPVLSAMLWGEVTSVLTSATIPPRIVERVGLEALPHRGAQRGQPLRLPLARAALRRPPPARPAGRRGGGGPARGAARSCWRRPAAAPWPSSPAGGPPRRRRRRWRPSSPTRCCSRAISRRAGCSRSSPPTRPPASSPPWASGRASTSRAAPSRS